ncbi:MAG: YggT family protein [Candidatus Avigastranaerophilus sp.]
MISYTISILFKIIYFIMIFAVLLSWIPILDTRKEPALTVIKIFNAIMAPFRAIIPPIGMIDISPIAAFLVLGFAERCIYKILFYFGL